MAALLALAGCGGGDSSSSDGGGEGTSSTSSTATTAAPQREVAPQSAKGGSASANKRGQGKGADGAQQGAESPDGTSQKHGPRIAQPKGKQEQAPSSDEVAQATVADMSLESPAVIAAEGHPGRLAATFTCDGKDSWPALHWGGIPAGTEELILYLMNVQPVEERLFVDWAVAGLDPSLDGVQAGELPKGAIVGTNGFGKRGYSICPEGAGEIYMFALYALPRALSPPKGFDAREFRAQILDASGNVGLLPTVYARG